jgi:RNA polymerase sigma-70 factor (ECF subfamily)
VRLCLTGLIDQPPLLGGSAAAGVARRCLKIRSGFTAPGRNPPASEVGIKPAKIRYNLLGKRVEDKIVRFEQAILPHLDAAYNLARWLTRNVHDAEDVVQEAYMRAFKSFETFRGGEGRPWLLAIVRNTCYSWMQRNRPVPFAIPIEEAADQIQSDECDPEALAIKGADVELLERALAELPVEYREALVLRELEGLSYKEIAGVVDIPVGTVMSRLARARKRLQQVITAGRNRGAGVEV